MIYRIRHCTSFLYSAAIRESVMEIRMCPRDDTRQRCLQFRLAISPDAKAHAYVDSLGNAVHHFDVPGEHTELKIESDSVVERLPQPKRRENLPMGAWTEVDRLASAGENWDWIHESHFIKTTERLKTFANELRTSRDVDPFNALLQLNQALHRNLKYVPAKTRVDSPIDECLEHRSGVCQDFSHVFIAIARMLKIPCRYVSGHLFHRPEDSTAGPHDASHAWPEALLPELGWVGFDPTNGKLADENHVVTAVGRDYFDVPPTRGVYKGFAESKMAVSVSVTRAEQDVR